MIIALEAKPRLPIERPKGYVEAAAADAGTVPPMAKSAEKKQLAAFNFLEFDKDEDPTESIEPVPRLVKLLDTKPDLQWYEVHVRIMDSGKG